jgi:multisubunit Na+/H+ antiporter MnhB subunit
MINIGLTNTEESKTKMEGLGFALLGTVGILFTFIAADSIKRRKTLKICENCGKLTDRCKCDGHMFIG